ncbi:hypothetical protein H1R20_g6811, partial [Candolleomyces eurysporus]
MASVAGRKKSIVSTAGLSIESGNTLLNKAASQSTSLYQQCSSLRSRLMRIHGFPHYFQLATSSDSRQSTDPVTQIWDVLSLGISLCYLFDQLPSDGRFAKIEYSHFNQERFEANPDKEKKHGIAKFAIQVKSDNVAQNIPGCEPFTVTDLWDRKSTDGLVKVINTVTAIVDYLPADAFEEAPPSPPTLSAHDSSDSLHDTLPPPPPTNARESRRIYITKEIIETERKYVEGLEIMQKYATQLAQQNIIDQDTIHLLFPNLNNLLNFQRKFLIRFEGTLEQPWSEQRWGQHFIECEDEFAVYELYCSNFTNAMELMVTLEGSLTAMNHFISVSELRAFHITPIQRVCKYPLFFGDLIKVATGDETYGYLDELKKGSDAVLRITAKINEAHRRADNEQIVKSLAKRITDWKGHHLENFGELLLEDVFVVTKSDIDREYHVFLFEKIILCCKEAPQQPPNARGGKSSKNNVISKKATPPTPVGAQSLASRDTPLLLKGRIFLGNVTQAIPVASRVSTTSGIPSNFPLQVWWKGDDDLEFFTLRCRSQDQMSKWEATINRLIKEAAQRRASERSNGISKIAHHYTSPGIIRAAHGDQPPFPGSTMSSAYSQASSTISSAHSTTRISRSTTPYHHDSMPGSSYSGPQGYPPHNGFDVENDDDDLEDYPLASGRGTPMGRRPNALSMPPEREHSITGYDRPRAQTESNDGPTIQQWRNNLPGPPSAHSPNTALRPLTPRLNSNMSANSYNSDGSFGNGLPSQPKQPSRPSLRSQFSSTRLKSGYDASSPGASSSPVMHDYRNGPTPTSNANALPPPPMNRSRSASQPSAYIPKPMPPPPLPTASPHWSSQPRGIPTNVNGSSNKRGSGSSQSTGDSSDYSPNSSSPITPFGSSESSLPGSGYGMNGYHQSQTGPPVKVKVHFHEDIFVIQVAKTTEYVELVEKVGRKIRLCGPRRDDGPLRVKYKDEDGDMVSLGSTEDVQMAFEAWRPGGQVTLFVT